MVWIRSFYYIYEENSNHPDILKTSIKKLIAKKQSKVSRTGSAENSQSASTPTISVDGEEPEEESDEEVSMDYNWLKDLLEPPSTKEYLTTF